MLKMIYSFVLGVIAGALGFWYFVHGPGQGKLEHAVDEAAAGANRLKENIHQTLTNFSASDIAEEMSRTGTVIREKARQAGAAIADSTSNARITTSIKTRLVADLGKQGFEINVDTTDGVVTLSGYATSHEQIARAVKVAIDTEGVHKVFSTIQLKRAN
jgi:osmotically-inducible protein OsmY